MLSSNSKVEARTSLNPKASLQVVNALTVYSGGFIGLNAPAGATAANNGRIQQWNTTILDLIPIGWKILDFVLGNTSPGAGVQIPEGELDLGSRIAENVAITGLNGAQTDVGRIVYMSDDNTFTTARPSHGIPAGMIVCNRVNSSTNADVYMFSFETLMAIAMGGGAHQLMYLGSLQAVALSNATQTTITMTSHGRLHNVYAVCRLQPTGAGATATLTPKINGVAASGGVVTVVLADTPSTVKAGTAFTAGSALDVFHENDSLTVVASAVTAFTAGVYDLYADFILEGGI